jgi:homoserine dehydrogenase
MRREAGMRVLPLDDVECRYYLRLAVADRPGVLAQVTGALGDSDISIASLIQRADAPGAGAAEIVIMTHTARESAVRQALRAIEALDGVQAVEQLLRVHAHDDGTRT